MLEFIRFPYVISMILWFRWSWATRLSLLGQAGRGKLEFLRWSWARQAWELGSYGYWIMNPTGGEVPTEWPLFRENVFPNTVGAYIWRNICFPLQWEYRFYDLGQAGHQLEFIKFLTNCAYHCSDSMDCTEFKIYTTWNFMIQEKINDPLKFITRRYKFYDLDKLGASLSLRVWQA